MPPSFPYLPHTSLDGDFDRGGKRSFAVEVFEPHDSTPLVVARLWFTKRVVFGCTEHQRDRRERSYEWRLIKHTTTGGYKYICDESVSKATVSYAILFKSLTACQVFGTDIRPVACLSMEVRLRVGNSVTFFIRPQHNLLNNGKTSLVTAWSRHIVQQTRTVPRGCDNGGWGGGALTTSART